MKNPSLVFSLILTILLCHAGHPSLLAKDYSWTFKSQEDLAGWGFDGLKNKEVVEGVLKLTATRGNPHILTPKVEVDAANQGSVIFSMKLGKGLQSKGCLLFITEDQPKWDDAAIVLFVCKGDGESHEYEVDMTKNALWKGKVVQLRFQPFYSQWPMPEEQRAVELDWFRVPDLNEPKK